MLAPSTTAWSPTWVDGRVVPTLDHLLTEEIEDLTSWVVAPTLC
jgi:hypothetical protein